MSRPRPTIVVELAGAPARVAKDLEAGGVFVPGCAMPINEDCELVLRRGGDEVRTMARVVWVDPVSGAGMQLVAPDPDTRKRIAALVHDERAPSATAAVERGAEADAADGDADADAADATATATAGDAAVTADDGDAARIAANVHERLRGLTLNEQLKIARRGEVHERIVLERIYGKTVWEALLRNPRLTGPEVARIARMGTLPRVLVELVVGNGAWLQLPEVRRALLANPRLGTDQIVRVLRLVPKHELKLAAIQTAYPHAVREMARRLLRDD